MSDKQPNSISGRYFNWRLFRRNGVYYADGRGGKYDLGKHSLGSRERDKALEKLRRLDEAKAIELGITEAASTVIPSTITIGDGWQRYLEYGDSNHVMGGASAATIKRYGAVRDKHIKFCLKHGIETWQAFDEQALRRYGNWLGKGSADRTVYLELTLLKSINGWMIKNKLLPASAKLVLSLKKPQGTDTFCYSSVEVTAMVDHCRANPKLVWLADVILGLAYTGARISELAGLRWTDVSFDGSGIIRIADERSSRRKRQAGTARTTKGKRSRTIPIHTEFRELLVGLPRHADGFVFHAARGGRVRSRNVLEQFIQHVIEPLKAKFPTPAGEIGFEHGRLHSLRHFFCSQCFLGGASEGEIKQWLGHADSKMVEHYRHLRSEDAQRKMNQIRFLERADGRPDVIRFVNPASTTASGNKENIPTTNEGAGETNGGSAAGQNLA